MIHDVLIQRVKNKKKGVRILFTNGSSKRFIFKLANKSEGSH